MSVVDVKELGHDWADATYSFAADGKSCTATRVCKNDSTHVETATATITSTVKTPATCTAMGTTTYTATFAETWATAQTKDVVDIDALGHEWTVTYVFAADGKSCTATRVCGNDASHKETATAEIKSAVKVPATCTAMGTTTYTATFTADWATAQTKDVVDIPALNHNYGAATYTWTADGKACTATRVCANDNSHVETSIATVTSVVVTAATCETNGTTAYTATFAADWATTQTKNIADIAAIGHDYEGVVTTDPTCTEKGVKTFTCKNDATHTYTEAVSATGHDYTLVVIAPTCEEKGLKIYTCKNDSTHTYTEEIAETGHTIVNDAAVAPTCTATGLTAGKHCLECNKVLVAQTVVPAKGHTAGAAATCTTAQTCTVCGVQLVAALGHTEEIIPAVAPTETSTGLTEGKKCSVCGEILLAQEVIPSLHVHKPSDDWKVDGDKHWRECSCGDIYDYGTHSYKRGECICGDIDESTGLISYTQTVIFAIENGTWADGSKDELITYVTVTGYNDPELVIPVDMIPTRGYGDGDWYIVETGKTVTYTYIFSDITDDSDDSDINYCACSCHSTNPIVKFFFKIITFLRKLFGMKEYQYCDCGNAHW